MAAAIDYKLHIEANPEIRFGKPVIKGTRIAVYDVLQWLASGMTPGDIIADFHNLLMSNCWRACLMLPIKNV
jgi:uncharacterized protein (DUF433 family)